MSDLISYGISLLGQRLVTDDTIVLSSFLLLNSPSFAFSNKFLSTCLSTFLWFASPMLRSLLPRGHWTIVSGGGASVGGSGASVVGGGASIKKIGSDYHKATAYYENEEKELLFIPVSSSVVVSVTSSVVVGDPVVVTPSVVTPSVEVGDAVVFTPSVVVGEHRATASSSSCQPKG